MRSALYTKIDKNNKKSGAILENVRYTDGSKPSDYAKGGASGVQRHVKANVPSQNPTAAGGYVSSGKERANHKYKGKVRTKSGKIRYIYDKDGVTTASGHHNSPQSAFDSQRHATHVSNKAAYMNAQKRRAASEERQRQSNADPIRNIQRTGNAMLRKGGKAIDSARKGIEEQITKTKRYLGKLFR